VLSHEGIKYSERMPERHKLAFLFISLIYIIARKETTYISSNKA
jgi:hypothetical protein